MPQHEYAGNLHIHTPYSDGTEYHSAIAAAAQRAGLDFIVVTDHNILVKGVEGYYRGDSGSVLLLTGEEVHNRFRLPQVSHLLVYGVNDELAEYGDRPQELIDQVNRRKGLSFIAHPYDARVPWMGPDSDGIPIPWVDWDVKNFTGIELWNYMSEFKDTMSTVRRTLYSIFRPEDTMIQPRPENLALWDKLLATGQHIVGIGNADAHGTYVNLGFMKHRVFPYDFLFSCINTHLLTSQPLTGVVEMDRRLLFEALRDGHAFIGYDRIGSTRGFRFTAQAEQTSAAMGNTVRLGSGVTLQALAPGRGRFKVIRHGEVVCELENTEAVTYVARESGAYRIEVWRTYRGIERCWIISNPIYVIG